MYKKNTEVEVLPVVDLFKESAKNVLWEMQHRFRDGGGRESYY